MTTPNPKITLVDEGMICTTKTAQYAYNKDAHEMVVSVLSRLNTLKEVEYMKLAKPENPFWEDHLRQMRKIRHTLEDLSRILP